MEPFKTKTPYRPSKLFLAICSTILLILLFPFIMSEFDSVIRMSVQEIDIKSGKVRDRKSFLGMDYYLKESETTVSTLYAKSTTPKEPQWRKVLIFSSYAFFSTPYHSSIFLMADLEEIFKKAPVSEEAKINTVSKFIEHLNALDSDFLARRYVWQLKSLVDKKGTYTLSDLEDINKALRAEFNNYKTGIENIAP